MEHYHPSLSSTSRDNLAKRQKVEDPNCIFCLEPESIQHLFFECVVAKQCWKLISDIAGYSVGLNLAVVGPVLA